MYNQGFNGVNQFVQLLRDWKKKHGDWKDRNHQEAVNRLPLNQNQLTDASAAGVPYSPEFLEQRQKAAMLRSAQVNPIDTSGFPQRRESPPVPSPSGPMASGPPPQATPPVSIAPKPAGYGPTPPPQTETDIFDELGPEGLNSVLGMGDLNRQMEYAQAMRQKASPEGRYLSGGRMYVASSPLEHLVTGYGRMKGKKDEKRIGGEMVDARKQLLELLRTKRMGGPSPTTGAGPVSNPMETMRI